MRTPTTAPRRDDLVLAAMMIAFGGLRVGIAIGEHERFTAQPTVALIMLVLGLAIMAWRR
jgi:hypothetical protein